MAKISGDKFYCVIQSKEWGVYDNIADAEAKARQRAWNEGETYYIMSPIAKASAPEQVNDVKVTQLA